MSNKTQFISRSSSDTKNRDVVRTFVQRGLWIILCVVLVGFVFILVKPSLMGTGSESYAQKWSERFEQIKSIEEAKSRYQGIGVREFPNEEWIIWISTDSHGNSGGGTVVTRDSMGSVRTFFGHVCGWAVLRGDSLDEVYEHLTEVYGTTRAEYLAKETAQSNDHD